MADIDRLLKILKDKKGSDLHLSPGNPPLGRISGELTPLEPTPLTAEMNQKLLYETMSESQRADYEKTHDLDFAHPVPDLDSRRIPADPYSNQDLTAVGPFREPLALHRTQ